MCDVLIPCFIFCKNGCFGGAVLNRENAGLDQERIIEEISLNNIASRCVHVCRDVTDIGAILNLLKRTAES